jgi:predicted nucleotidyltransferase
MAQVLENRIELPSLAEDEGEVTADKIVFAVQEIVRIANPVRVIAFGSRARGDHRRTSDLDLAVVVDKYDRKLDQRPLWRADLNVWMEMDVLVYDVARENALADVPTSLQSEVEKEGVVLYERSQGVINRAAIARLVQR